MTSPNSEICLIMFSEAYLIVMFLWQPPGILISHMWPQKANGTFLKTAELHL